MFDLNGIIAVIMGLVSLKNYITRCETFSVDYDRNFSHFTVVFLQFVDQLLSLFGTDFVCEDRLVLDRDLVEDRQTYCR